MTAEALKTITAPIMHSARVARNNQRSVWRLRGTFNSPGWLARFPEASGMLQIPHQLLEEAAAVLVVLKLVEAGARRCQQHHVAWPGALTRQAHRPVQRACHFDRGRTGDLFGDFFCGGPRSEEHTSEPQSTCNLVCRLL